MIRVVAYGGQSINTFPLEQGLYVDFGFKNGGRWNKSRPMAQLTVNGETTELGKQTPGMAEAGGISILSNTCESCRCDLYYCEAEYDPVLSFIQIQKEEKAKKSADWIFY